MKVQQTSTLEEYVRHPPERMEWVNHQLTETTTTIRHAIVQSRLSCAWANYIDFIGDRGCTLIGVACRTHQNGRRPDLAYLPADLIAQFEDASALSHSCPLIAEIAAPEDSAEGLFAKAIEYLESGCEEVWLVFPEARLIMVKTQAQAWQLFTPGQTVCTQKMLRGFEIAIDTLLA